jgi:ankyrin repeat protein
MVAREVVGRFIDAAVDDHDEAQQLLDAHPDLRHAAWLGDEHVLIFLVVENFMRGVQFCLEHRFNPNQIDGEFGTSPLHLACKLNYPEISECLLRHGADPNAVSAIDDTPIHCAIQTGNADLVETLIEYGADPNYTTELGETIFDNWPPWAEESLSGVIAKYQIKRPKGGPSDEGP